jgi:hypothetical protein
VSVREPSRPPALQRPDAGAGRRRAQHDGS